MTDQTDRDAATSPSTPPMETVEIEASPSWIPPIAVGLAYFVFFQIAYRLPNSLGTILITTVVSLGLVIWFTALAAYTMRGAGQAALHLVASAAVVIPLRVLSVSRPGSVAWVHAVFGGVPDLLFIWMAVALGTLLSRLLRSANMIPPVAGALALVDIWTVLLGGPVAQIMKSDNPAAKAVTHAMTVQMAGKPTGATAIPVVGFADFLFIAFFVAAMCRFVPRRETYLRTVRSLAFLLVLYMLVVFFTQWNLPALAPMAIVMIGVHWREFAYTREEKFALLYAALLVVGIVGVFTVVRK